MGEGIVVPNVCRYTINGTYGGRPVANIFDLLIEVDPSSNRGAAILEGAEILLDNWNDRILPRVVNDYVADSVSWVDLNSAFGTVGTITSFDATIWPAAGAGTGEAMPANVAIRAIKNITASRGQRKGRTYFVGVAEGDTTGNPNILNGAAVTAWNTALSGFRAQLAYTGIHGSGLPVVIHTRLNKLVTPPVLEVTGTSVVSSMTVDPTLATQRRRLRS